MATISARLSSGYRVELTNGSHTWRADEPIDLGGTDTGPNPYELLLGSVAACTCITLSMYARRKEIPLTSVTARYRYDKVHAEDCEFCEDEDKGLIDTVSSDIEIGGDFTPEQAKRLQEVATRCPVHKTLEREIRFTDAVRTVAG
ncbi:MAG: OsmC family protein [Thermoleophilia bacterium]|nr:OsmC family protein [Thermoleophilia bacterium]